MRISTPWSQQCERKTMNIPTNFLSFFLHFTMMSIPRSLLSNWLYSEFHATISWTSLPVSHSHSWSCRWRQIPLQLPNYTSLQSCMMHHTITQCNANTATCTLSATVQFWCSLHMPNMRSILAEPCTDLSICGCTIPLTAAKLHRTSCHFKNDTKHVILKMK